MRKRIVKAGQMKNLRNVVEMVFEDGKVTGDKARVAKRYFGELIINSL